MMRKMTVFLVLFVTLTCTACTKEAPQDIDVNYTDNFIYANMNGTFFRFGVDNATASPLCPDPLCAHNDKSCPFFRMEGAPVFRGQYIYYLSGGSELGGATRLSRFNLQTGRYEVMYSAKSGTLSGMNVAGEYVYFNLSQWSEDGEVAFLLLKCHMKHNTVTLLSDDALPTPQTLIAAYNGRLFWNTGSGEYYSTDAMRHIKTGSTATEATLTDFQAGSIPLSLNQRGKSRVCPAVSCRCFDCCEKTG